MNKIRGVNELTDYLDKEISWRIKEIANLKISIDISDNPQQKTLIRPAIPLLYAHWEGFIKNASEAYLNFVQNQNHRYGELAKCFIAIGLKKEIDKLNKSKKTAKLYISLIEFIYNRTEKTTNINFSNSISTNSNLNSSVFDDIAVSLGIKTSIFEPKYNFIDKSLLYRRNNIAHGEYLELDKKSYSELSEEVLILVRQFKTEIENSAIQKKYIS